MNMHKKKMKTTSPSAATLPKEIVHKIMSLLSQPDLTRASLVSRHFHWCFRSLPVFDIDYGFFLDNVLVNRSQREKEFYRFVSDSIRRRDALGDQRLARVTFRASASLSSSGQFFIDSALELMVSFAWRTRAEELVFDCVFKPWKTPYNLPLSVFSPRSVRTMRLSGLALNFPQGSNMTAVLNSPSLESLTLARCSNSSHEFKIKLRCPKLNSAEIVDCEGLRRIVIHRDTASSLESFSFTKFSTTRCDIVGLETCTSLKRLELSGRQATDEEWLSNTVDFSVFKNLEVLRLKKCEAVTRVSTCNEALKTLDLIECWAIEAVDVLAPNLEFFQHTHSSHRLDECRIVHAAREFENLRDLRLTEVRVDNISGPLGFPFLENLTVERCDSVKKLAFESDSLKRFELNNCDNLISLAIDAPNLVSMVYTGEVIIEPAILTSCNLEAVITLISNKKNYYCDHEAFRNFISHFGHSKKLTLVCYRPRLLFIPWKLRDQMVPPLYDLQNLDVKLPQGIVSNNEELVDCLLWLAPHPKIISITLGTTLLAILEFHEEEVENLDEDDLLCCHNLPIKCWRHHLTRVEVKDIEGVKPNLELKRYFMNNINMFKSCATRKNI